ncbi:MAG: 4Fe-4S binding protein [Thermoplasmata archaeon]|nr:MAG: 4Fe-4S binding protein [Thermoplasmata archaeon]
MAGEFGVILGGMILLIVLVILFINFGGPKFRLAVQVFSFGFHRLGIFRKLPGGWHAPIPRTSGITCTLNCQACELAWLGCPVGMLQQYVINFRFPFYVFGVLLAFGTALGRAVCGWLCPFGLILDMCNKVCTHQYKPPDSLRYFKYVYLAGVVILASLTGFIFWCRYLCFGALLGVIPYWLTWQTVSAFWLIYHLATFAFYFTFSYYTHGRAWCRYFCPLGAIFALLNPFSTVKRNYDWKWCTQCERCVKTCPMGLDPTKDNLHSKLDCIKCGRCARECKSNALTVSSPLIGGMFKGKKD